MKMMSSTSMKSTNGVTLISEFSSSPLPAFIAIAHRLRSSQEVPLDDVEVVLLERIHLRAQDADSPGEVVVGHHRRDRGDQADRGGEQRLGDMGTDGEQDRK